MTKFAKIYKLILKQGFYVFLLFNTAFNFQDNELSILKLVENAKIDENERR